MVQNQLPSCNKDGRQQFGPTQQLHAVAAEAVAVAKKLTASSRANIATPMIFTSFLTLFQGDQQFISLVHLIFLVSYTY
jgi:hypothetical protein